MIVALGGRMARAYVAEMHGVWRDDWTVEAMAAEADAIRNDPDPLVFPVVPTGFVDHLGYSFEVAREGAKSLAE